MSYAVFMEGVARLAGQFSTSLAKSLIRLHFLP
jgi:hypothetical protein